MSPRRKLELGQPVIVDGKVLGYQLPLPGPDKETKRANTRRPT
ncbi:hypothetical protein [Nonomuraea sp. NPDC049784]